MTELTKYLFGCCVHDTKKDEIFDYFVEKPIPITEDKLLIDEDYIIIVNENGNVGTYIYHNSLKNQYIRHVYHDYLH